MIYISLKYSQIVTAGLVFLFLVLPSCLSSMRNKDCNVLKEVLIDFEFVGSGIHQIQQDKEIPQLPKKFEPGRWYIFHSQNTVNDEKLFEMLQERLQSKGISITSAKVDFYPTTGGPFFTISFQTKDCKGTIFNTSHKQIDNETPDQRRVLTDYVLVVENMNN